MSWDKAKYMLNDLFSDEEERGVIRGCLLKKTESERLEYFVESCKEITTALRTLLPSAASATTGNDLVTWCWGIDRALKRYHSTFN
ncbi:3545_t:CDS:2 [Paraglomus occultum]|uniref:3545_t:CDS:1 n=1 Tax=Paraglomus occultum TaxID=144539 RepID=A0A9N9GW48_9GLOM|nr:3545_t:CDS:2 [Paraglomus occultum]